jgi:hypothetical protein
MIILEQAQTIQLFEFTENDRKHHRSLRLTA